MKRIFEGNDELILGFNAFLPEGYQIELDDPVEGLQNGEQGSAPMVEEGKEGDGQVVDPGNVGVDPPLPLEELNAEIPPSTSTPSTTTTKPAMQQQYAINYVTTIRNRFTTSPETYREFLKILHTYQREQKGIKEV